MPEHGAGVVELETHARIDAPAVRTHDDAAQKGLVVPAADVAASFQRAAVEPLVLNTVRLACERGIGTVTAGGGVVANAYLRQRLKEECKKCGLKLVLPQIAFCTDNAAMIAAEGLNKYLAGDFSPLDINAAAHIPLG